MAFGDAMANVISCFGRSELQKNTRLQQPVFE